MLRLLTRSSSVAVNPNFSTRSASVKSASRPRSTPSSFTPALSVDTSSGRTNWPRPAPAPRNGASGFCAISEKRVESMPPNSRSTICLAVRTDRRLIARRHLAVDRDARARRFFVGGDRVQRARLFRHVVGGAQLGRRRLGDRSRNDS